ncbi:MAG: DMT family transporter [Alistipes sp.]|nr:DMT family transporter [Alistipes sp.]
MIAANLLFGANFSFYVSLIHSYIGYRQLFLWQVIAAALFFIPSALFSPRTYRISWRDALHLLLVSVLVIYGWMYMLLWGSSYTTPIDAAIIATLGPAFTLMIDHLLHRRATFSHSRIVGVGCILAGAWLLIFDKGFVLIHGSRGYGNLLVLCAVLAIATNTVLIRPQLERLGARVVIGWYYFFGLGITLPFFHRTINPGLLLELPLPALGELAYILLLGTVWPMWLLYRGSEQLGAVPTALYRYIQPLIAGSLALYRHQAQFDATSVAALVVIFVGIVLIVIGYRASLQALSESLAPHRLRRKR